MDVVNIKLRFLRLSLIILAVTLFIGTSVFWYKFDITFDAIEL